MDEYNYNLGMSAKVTLQAVYNFCKNVSEMGDIPDLCKFTAKEVIALINRLYEGKLCEKNLKTK